MRTVLLPSIALVALLVAGCAASPSPASAPEDKPAAPEARWPRMTPEEQGALGPHHEQLARLWGRWKAEWTARAGDTPAQKLVTHADALSQMGGRFVSISYHVGFPDRRVHQLLVIGFNNVTGKYEGMRMPMRGTELLRLEGEPAEGDNRIILAGQEASGVLGRYVPVRIEIQFGEEDSFRLVETSGTPADRAGFRLEINHSRLPD